MYTQGILVAQRGDYKLYRGKLSGGDSRSFYGAGPVVTGRIAPIASFFSENDGLVWLREQDVAKESPQMV